MGSDLRCGPPGLDLVLTIRLTAAHGRLNLRRAALTHVPQGAMVRVDAGAARYFDRVDVALFAATLEPAASVQIEAESSTMLRELCQALAAAWRTT